MKYIIRVQKGLVHKYYKREGTKGNYTYYYTKEEYDKAKGTKEHNELVKDEKNNFIDFITKQGYKKEDIYYNSDNYIKDNVIVSIPKQNHESLFLVNVFDKQFEFKSYGDIESFIKTYNSIYENTLNDLIVKFTEIKQRAEKYKGTDNYRLAKKQLLEQYLYYQDGIWNSFYDNADKVQLEDIYKAKNNNIALYLNRLSGSKKKNSNWDYDKILDYLDKK